MKTHPANIPDLKSEFNSVLLHVMTSTPDKKQECRGDDGSHVKKVIFKH
jgi:hypothetical protein